MNDLGVPDLPPLDDPITGGKVFAVDTKGEPGDADPATPASGVTLLHLAIEFDDIGVRTGSRPSAMHACTRTGAP